MANFDFGNWSLPVAIVVVVVVFAVAVVVALEGRGRMGDGGERRGGGSCDVYKVDVGNSDGLGNGRVECCLFLRLLSLSLAKRYGFDCRQCHNFSNNSLFPGNFSLVHPSLLESGVKPTKCLLLFKMGIMNGVELR